MSGASEEGTGVPAVADPAPARAPAGRSRSFEASWVAAVRSTADSLEGELQRAPDANPPADFKIAKDAIGRAQHLADRPALEVSGRFRWIQRLWHGTAAWWTGNEVNEAWQALHIAGQALLTIEDDFVVKSQLGDMAAAVVTALTPQDIRTKDYLKTLEMLAPPKVPISLADRAQLRDIRQVCDSTSDAGHGDARVYRNTLIQLGLLLSIVLAVVAIAAAFDQGFRSVFSAPKTSPGPGYVLELELVASLAGLTSAVLTLRNYAGFQFTYGLPLVQALLKGSAGAATGLLGVLLVQSGIISSLKPQAGGGIFAIALIFGSTQYLFTRLVDQQAKVILESAGSRNDPATSPEAAPGATPPSLLTTSDEASKQGPVIPPKVPVSPA